MFGLCNRSNRHIAGMSHSDTNTHSRRPTSPFCIPQRIILHRRMMIHGRKGIPMSSFVPRGKKALSEDLSFTGPPLEGHLPVVSWASSQIVGDVQKEPNTALDAGSRLRLLYEYVMRMEFSYHMTEHRNNVCIGKCWVFATFLYER